MVAQIIRQCHQEARQLLMDNREMLDAVAQYLLKKETITGQEMMAILEGKDPEQTEYFGITSGAVPKQDQDGIEPPAKSIHIISAPVAVPSQAAEQPEQSAVRPDSAGSGSKDRTSDSSHSPEGNREDSAPPSAQE